MPPTKSPCIDLADALQGKWDDTCRPAALFAQHIQPNPGPYVGGILDGLRSSQSKLQAGCAELASLLSESHPDLLYPYLDTFIGFLQAKQPILRWEAVCTVGNLVRVDAAKSIPPHVPTIAALLHHESIVLQGHAVRALTKIASHYPDLAGDILQKLVASKNHFAGNRVGVLVEAMAAFSFDNALRDKALAFARTYATADIKSVATKAKRSIKALQPDSPTKAKRAPTKRA